MRLRAGTRRPWATCSSLEEAQRFGARAILCSCVRDAQNADVLDALLSQYRSDPTARAALSKRVEDQRHAAASARGAGGAEAREPRLAPRAAAAQHGAAPAPPPSRPTARPRRRLASVVAERSLRGVVGASVCRRDAAMAAVAVAAAAADRRRRAAAAAGRSAWAEEVSRARGHLGRDPDAQLNALVRARRRGLELAHFR